MKASRARREGGRPRACGRQATDARTTRMVLRALLLPTAALCNAPVTFRNHVALPVCVVVLEPTMYLLCWRGGKANTPTRRLAAPTECST
eukprot:3622802-Amphidinium_carterae.3